MYNISSDIYTCAFQEAAKKIREVYSTFAIFNMRFLLKLLVHLPLVLIALVTETAYAVSSDIAVLKDVSYGAANKQTLDVYYPSNKTKDAPVIFMVHGGAWRIGDKASKSVVRNKVNHWVSKGFILISINYRMLPKTRPIEQAKDVEKALIFSQQRIREWGGSADKFVLMGHSAGAHLVSLISVRPDPQILPWLGTVALDSAAYDIVKIMNSGSPPRFYKRAFGRVPSYWNAASPLHVLNAKTPSFLAVCSTKRKDDSCSQARSFVDKAKGFGTDSQLLPMPLSHRKLNLELGSDNCYTQHVDEFIRKLHPSFSSLLVSQSKHRGCNSERLP